MKRRSHLHKPLPTSIRTSAAPCRCHGTCTKGWKLVEKCCSPFACPQRRNQSEHFVAGHRWSRQIKRRRTRSPSFGETVHHRLHRTPEGVSRLDTESIKVDAIRPACGCRLAVCLKGRFGRLLRGSLCTVPYYAWKVITGKGFIVTHHPRLIAWLTMHFVLHSLAAASFPNVTDKSS